MEILAHPAVDAFRRLAREWCSLVEGAEELARGEFVQHARKLLAQLYVAALSLPEVDPATDEALDVGWDAVAERRAAKTLRERLGEWGYHAVWEVDLALKPELLVGNVVDDLADVYAELARGLVALDRGLDPRDVVWDWRFGFETDWGRHVLDALRATHAPSR